MLLYRSLLLLVLLPAAHAAHAATAVFAGGCFWCVEALYQEVEGVSDVVSGFTGGTLPNPTYSGNHDGHWEAVRVEYDPAVVSYRELLDLYWVNIDPFNARGQFCDKGPSYRAAIFVADDRERRLAEASKRAVESRFPGRDIETDILPAGRFWLVEAHHQDYYKKNPIRYRFYRSRCGRDARLESIWGDDARH